MPASSSFASIRLKAKVEKAFQMSYCLVFRPESLPIKNVATPTRATVPCVTMFTEGLPWLSGGDLELVMGRALCDWIGWELPFD